MSLGFPIGYLGFPIKYLECLGFLTVDFQLNFSNVPSNVFGFSVGYLGCLEFLRFLLGSLYISRRTISRFQLLPGVISYRY